MQNISFLIGAGFSVPAGFPTANKINNRLKKIAADEIGNYSDESAWFLEGKKNPNPPWKNKFVEEFLKFYNSNILISGKEYDYEEFYDYYNEHHTQRKYPKQLDTFLRKFLEKHNVETDLNDLLFQFDLIFNQLINGLLFKEFNRSFTKTYPQNFDTIYSNYKAFLDLTGELATQNIVHIHSLNHDLFIEYLATFDNWKTELDSGFEEFGSPYFGWLRLDDEKFMDSLIRLSRFTNKYDEQIRLYKLHGGIDHYWFRDDDNNYELIKLKKKIHEIDVFKEVFVAGKGKYVNNPMHIYPDFLSGTTAKIERYSKGTYYPAMFKHFGENLISSNNIIIIGYGFRDSKINEYINDSFLEGQNKTMFIVDINEPKIELLQREKVHFIGGGVEAMDIQFILSNLS